MTDVLKKHMRWTDLIWEAVDRHRHDSERYLELGSSRRTVQLTVKAKGDRFHTSCSVSVQTRHYEDP
jgi:hypothetical protein